MRLTGLAMVYGGYSSGWLVLTLLSQTHWATPASQGGREGCPDTCFHPSSHALKAGGGNKKALSQLPFLSAPSEPERMEGAIEQANELS